MKLDVSRSGLKITPESVLDEVYLEELYSARKEGDIITFVRGEPLWPDGKFEFHALVTTAPWNKPQQETSQRTVNHEDYDGNGREKD